MKRTISILLLLLGITLFSQQTTAQKELLKKANENLELLHTDPEKAFIEAKKTEKQARKTNEREAELQAIETQGSYYEIKNDFKNMIITGNSLFYKAKSYEMPVYQTIAKNILFEAYTFSGLQEKALQELNEGMKILEKSYKEDSIDIITKANLLISYSGYHMLKNDYKNQLNYIKLSGDEFEKMPDGIYKQELLYIHYSNLADAYYNIGLMDSAKYYAELSQLEDKGYERKGVRFNNLLLLGKIVKKKGQYEKGIFFFKEAEKTKGYKNHLNLNDLYDNIIQSYQQLHQLDSAKLYQVKKDYLKLSISENQNKSLHNLLNEKEKNPNQWYVYVLVLLLVFVLILVFLIFRKNKILAEQEKISQQYMEKISENPSSEDYSKLLKALKENDPAFMFYFEEAFPGFSSKLLQINPKISSSEIEFCALLKIKTPTKEIAKYRYFEPQTVRNKKYRIRKKLQIPKEADIYQWFDKF